MISFGIDYIISLLFRARMQLYTLLAPQHVLAALAAWLLLCGLLVLFSVLVTAKLAPSAAGSGIPEMKTILRGVKLKEYLTGKTLLAKVIGLASILGSGLPLGKEGPVMHMASILATMLQDIVKAINGYEENDQRS